MSGFFVTVQIENDKKIVEIIKYSTSVNYEYTDYVYSALEGSNVKFEDFDCFLNVHGARIEENILVKYMEQFLYQRCACLLLRVKTKLILDMNMVEELNTTKFILDMNTVEELNTSLYENFNAEEEIFKGGLKRSNAAIGLSLLITPESIKGYLKRKPEGSKIFLDFEQTGCLKNTYRRKIVSYLAAFIHENFGFKPTKYQQLTVAEACQKLFPCLKADLLFNSTNSGFLQIKLKNERVKKRKIENGFEVNSNETIELLNPPIDKKTIEQDIHILISASLPEEVPLAKEKLKATLDYRKFESQKENFCIYDNCRYFFVCPELIVFDFELRFGTTQKLSEHWQSYQKHIFSIVKSSGKTLLYTETDKNIDWDTQTLSVLNLLRLLPPSPAGRIKFHRLTDEQAVSNLIVHKQPGLQNEDYIGQSSGKTPFIVAVGKTKTEIQQYLIVIDNNLIPISKNLQFIDALDLVFKLHFIFDIKYDNNLRLFWSFLQKYLYNMDLFNIPVTLQDLQQKFLSISTAN